MSAWPELSEGVVAAHQEATSLGPEFPGRSNVVILSSFVEGEEPVKSERFRVVAGKCIEDYDYWGYWDALWRTKDTIINVEHDMEFSDELVQQLLDCPHPLCAHVYHLPGSDKLYCYREGALPPAAGFGRWFEAPRELYPATDDRPAVMARGKEWATYGGIGFCKVTAEARVRELEPRDWSTLDINITKSVEGAEVAHPSAEVGRRWHCHWPGVQHFHN